MARYVDGLPRLAGVFGLAAFVRLVGAATAGWCVIGQIGQVFENRISQRLVFLSGEISNTNRTACVQLRQKHQHFHGSIVRGGVVRCYPTGGVRDSLALN